MKKKELDTTLRANSRGEARRLALVERGGLADTYGHSIDKSRKVKATAVAQGKKKDFFKS